MGPAGASPPCVCSSQASLFAELPMSNCESLLSGPLFKHLEICAEGCSGAVTTGGVMGHAGACGAWRCGQFDLPSHFFAPADAKVEAGSNEALMAEITTSTDATAEEERTPSAEEGGHEALAVEEGGKRRPPLWRGATRLCAFLPGPCVPCAFAA